MHDAVRGEHIARRAARSNVWDRTGVKTLKGLPYPEAVLRRGRRVGASEGRVILWGAGGFGGSPPGSRSAWEEIGRNPGHGFRSRTLEGQNPREHPAVTGSKARRSPGTLGRDQAQEPQPIGPAHRLGGGSTDRRNGKWVRPGGNAPGTFREEKAPKGESHERCRCETKPARNRRE